MIKIGITGGIGCGKSVVSELLRTMGYPVFDADSEAKQLMAHSEIIRRQLIDLFGPEVYVGNELNRPYLGSLIFHNPDARAQVNAIVHPCVRQWLHEWSVAQRSEIVFFESAILYESGFQLQADRVWVVSAPDDMRLKRTMERDNATLEQVKMRMQAQLSQQEKEKRADLVILNDGKHALIPQVLGGLASLLCPQQPKTAL